MSDGGKGSAPRPFSVDDETFKRNFDAIFRNKNSSGAECAVANDDAITGIKEAKENKEENPSESKIGD